MSENHQRNRPEKLDLPEAPKNSHGKRPSKKPQLPFKLKLQQIRANSENQVIEQFIQYRKNFIQQIEEYGFAV